MRQPLTKRQHEVFDYIAATIEEHGYAPSLNEIAATFQLSSLASVHKHLETLKAKGYIVRAFNRSRSMAIRPEPDCCPTCGRKLEEAKGGAAAQ